MRCFRSRLPLATVGGTRVDAAEALGGALECLTFPLGSARSRQRELFQMLSDDRDLKLRNQHPAIRPNNIKGEPEAGPARYDPAPERGFGYNVGKEVRRARNIVKSLIAYFEPASRWAARRGVV
jgi:hypothetical protein